MKVVNPRETLKKGSDSRPPSSKRSELLRATDEGGEGGQVGRRTKTNTDNTIDESGAWPNKYVFHACR